MGCPDAEVPDTVLCRPGTLGSYFFVCPVEGLVTVVRAAGTAAVPAVEVVASIPIGRGPGFEVFEELTPGVAKVPEGGMGSTTAMQRIPTEVPPVVIRPRQSMPKAARDA